VRPLNFTVSRRDGGTTLISALSGVELVRQRPQMYFPHGVTPTAISLCLVDDALALGATHVSVDHVDRWWIVSADVDWLRLPESRAIAMDRLFVGMHVHPSHINGVRSEIFVGAFAEVAYVATPDETTVVVGNDPLPEAVSRVLCSAPCIRSLAFRLRDG
jgi:hypothetical protein